MIHTDYSYKDVTVHSPLNFDEIYELVDIKLKREIILNLTNIRILPSLVISWIIANKDFVYLANPSTLTLKNFDVLGIKSMLNIYSSVADAMKVVQRIQEQRVMIARSKIIPSPKDPLEETLFPWKIK